MYFTPLGIPLLLGQDYGGACITILKKQLFIYLDLSKTSM